MEQPPAEAANTVAPARDGASIRRFLKVFRETDTTGEGCIPVSELRGALEQCAIRTPAALEELGGFVAAAQAQAQPAEPPAEGEEPRPPTIGFQEFYALARRLQDLQAQKRAKGPHILRPYLTPEMLEVCAAAFRERCNGEGLLPVDDLDAFLKACKVVVPPERVQSAMAELDEEQAGFLDQATAIVLVIKSAGLEKRQVGPGLCSLAALEAEGWTQLELRDVGFGARELLEAGHPPCELVAAGLPAEELVAAGAPLSELLGCDWGGKKPRHAGATLAQCLEAGCSLQRIRRAGWDDLESAAALRKHGLDAGRMLAAGWPPSVLKSAGYSATALRQGGVSQATLVALSQAFAVQDKQSGRERRGTVAIQREAAKLLQASLAEQTLAAPVLAATLNGTLSGTRTSLCPAKGAPKEDGG